MLTAPLHTGHVTLYEFSSRQSLLQWTRSRATEQLRPQSGLLQDMGYRPAASLLVVVHNVDKQKQCLLNVWRCIDHCVTDGATVYILVHVCGQMWILEHYYDIITH